MIPSSSRERGRGKCLFLFRCNAELTRQPLEDAIDSASNFRTRHLHIMREGERARADAEDRNGNIQLDVEWSVDRKYRSFCKREFCLCNISAFRRSISLCFLVSTGRVLDGRGEALVIGKLSISIFGIVHRVEHNQYYDIAAVFFKTVCLDTAPVAAPYFRSKSFIGSF